MVRGEASCGPRVVGGGDLPGPKVLVISQEFSEALGRRPVRMLRRMQGASMSS